MKIIPKEKDKRYICYCNRCDRIVKTKTIIIVDEICPVCGKLYDWICTCCGNTFDTITKRELVEKKSVKEKPTITERDFNIVIDLLGEYVCGNCEERDGKYYSLGQCQCKVCFDCKKVLEPKCCCYCYDPCVWDDF